MSLKAFHLVFISVSILLTLGCAVWGVASYVDDRNAGHVVFALGALVCGGALVMYSRYVLKKLKHISYL